MGKHALDTLVLGAYVGMLLRPIAGTAVVDFAGVELNDSSDSGARAPHIQCD